MYCSFPNVRVKAVLPACLISFDILISTITCQIGIICYNGSSTCWQIQTTTNPIFKIDWRELHATCLYRLWRSVEIQQSTPG
jgi:hypothetical protein